MNMFSTKRESLSHLDTNDILFEEGEGATTSFRETNIHPPHPKKKIHREIRKLKNKVELYHDLFIIFSIHLYHTLALHMYNHKM